MRESDLISFDLQAHALDVALTDAQMKSRLNETPLLRKPIDSRWLRRYASLVTSASTGAVLRDE